MVRRCSGSSSTTASKVEMAISGELSEVVTTMIGPCDRVSDSTVNSAVAPWLLSVFVADGSSMERARASLTPVRPSRSR
jgi:hypothetical protein